MARCLGLFSSSSSSRTAGTSSRVGKLHPAGLGAAFTIFLSTTNMYQACYAEMLQAPGRHQALPAREASVSEAGSEAVSLPMNAVTNTRYPRAIGLSARTSGKPSLSPAVCWALGCSPGTQEPRLCSRLWGVWHTQQPPLNELGEVHGHGSRPITLKPNLGSSHDFVLTQDLRKDKTKKAEVGWGGSPQPSTGEWLGHSPIGVQRGGQRGIASLTHWPALRLPTRT